MAEREYKSNDLQTLTSNNLHPLSTRIIRLKLPDNLPRVVYNPAIGGQFEAQMPGFLAGLISVVMLVVITTSALLYFSVVSHRTELCKTNARLPSH